jgi:hypothetical protein
MNVWASIADKALGVLEKFLDPEQYSIAQSKRQEKAIAWAEKEFELTEELFKFMLDHLGIFHQHKDKIAKYKKIHEKYKSRFNKYD